MRMLESEGFRYDGYIDIFDGGPSMAAPIDQVRTVREARSLTFTGTNGSDNGLRMMVASGRLDGFACCYGRVLAQPDDTATLDAASAELLGIAPGQSFLAVSR